MHQEKSHMHTGRVRSCNCVVAHLCSVAGQLSLTVEGGTSKKGTRLLLQDTSLDITEPTVRNMQASKEQASKQACTAQEAEHIVKCIRSMPRNRMSMPSNRLGMLPPTDQTPTDQQDEHAKHKRP